MRLLKRLILSFAVLAIVPLMIMAGIWLGCQSPSRLTMVLLLHQAALVAVVLLRASWLRWVAARVGERTHRAGALNVVPVR